MELIAAGKFLLETLATLVAKAAGAALGSKVKDWLKEESQREAFERALNGALADLQQRFPQVAASFFDEHFLRNVVTAELSLMFTRDQRPSPERISEAYSSQFHASGVDAYQAAEFFIDRLAEAMKREAPLQDLLNSRQIEQVHRILASLGALRLDPSPVTPIDEGVARPADSAIQEAFSGASEELLGWPQTLDDGRWIDRPEFDLLVSAVSSAQGSTSILLGPPGAGKSALMARFGQKCLEDGLEVLAVKADQLPPDIASLADLQRWLNLDEPLLRVLAILAAQKRTVLIVDQLDALSELVDLKTGRLTALVELIRRGSRIPNLHIVCSCRDFERKYDARLSRIEAEEIQLPLVEWKVIAEILAARGIKAEGWPEEFRNILRYPQNLKIFLQYFSTPSEQAVFNSYQAMLEHLWSKRFFRTPESSTAVALLNRIAADMAEEEILHAPAARYESSRRDLDYLVSVGVLRFDRDGLQISFTHQTLFDFAHARAFVSQAGSLSQFVLERQSGLFVRPKLWSALAYLRAADAPAYRREFLALWNAPQLREHLKLLLIDFAGMQVEPTAFEIQALRGVLAETRYRGKVLASIAGKKAWFDAIREDLLPDLMSAGVGEAWRARLVLQEAWPFAKPEVLELLERHWLSDGEKRNQVLTTLSSLGQWDETSLALAIRIVALGGIHDRAVAHLASVVSAAAPSLALRLVAAQLNPKLRAAMTPGASRSALKELIDRPNTDWYELVEMVEAAPLTWIEEVWPVLRSALEFVSTESTVINAYRGDSLLSTLLEDGEQAHHEYPFLDGTRLAIRAFAKTDPDRFEKFVAANESSEAMSVHRLLAIGMADIADIKPKLGLEYLLTDARRLQLENFHEQERETKLVIRSIVPHLSADDCLRLERAILAASEEKPGFREEDAKARFERKKYNRQFRLRLLQQFPAERLTPEAQKHIREERIAFPRFEDKRREIVVREGRSSMSAEQMARAGDEDIVRFLKQNPDDTGWGDIFEGKSGSINASRAFAELAKVNPERAIRIFDRLNAGTDERPVALAIEAIALENLPLDRLVTLVQGLQSRGFTSAEFLESVGSALRNRVVAGAGLPDHVLAMLEAWLKTTPIAEIKPKTKGEEPDREDESVLWGYGGIHILPHGTRTFLNAIVFGLMAREPIPGKRLFQSLSDHLAKGDTIRVWESIAYDLSRNIARCSAAEAEPFLESLFAQYPELLQTKGAMYLVAYSLRLVRTEIAQTWLTAIKNSGWVNDKLAYGELLVIHRLVSGGSLWADGELRSLISSPPGEDHPDAKVLVGAIHSAVHLRKDIEQDRDLLHGLIRAGLMSTNAQAHRAALDYFRVNEHSGTSATAGQIMEALVEGPALDSGKSHSFLIDTLLDMVPDCPDLVYRICVRMLQAHGADVGNLATAAVMDAEGIMNIAMTLQRLDEPHRTNGLALFEKLVELDAYRAREVLMDVDRRPGQTAMAPMRRRRKARRKK